MTGCVLFSNENYQPLEVTDMSKQSRVAKRKSDLLHSQKYIQQCMTYLNRQSTAHTSPEHKALEKLVKIVSTKFSLF